MHFTPISILFNNKQQAIPAVLETCINHIHEKINNLPTDNQFIYKIKWVISEMLSNSLKHSETDECVLTISVYDDQIILEKRDSGKPLVLTEKDTENKIQWPLTTITNLDCEIYHNGMDSLRVESAEGHQATFYIENMEIIGMPILLSEISEHFGLLIIAKSCDRFIYEYDTKSKTNIFTSYFSLKHI